MVTHCTQWDVAHNDNCTVWHMVDYCTSHLQKWGQVLWPRNTRGMSYHKRPLALIWRLIFHLPCYRTKSPWHLSRHPQSAPGQVTLTLQPLLTLHNIHALQLLQIRVEYRLFAEKANHTRIYTSITPVIINTVAAAWDDLVSWARHQITALQRERLPGQMSLLLATCMLKGHGHLGV